MEEVDRDAQYAYRFISRHLLSFNISDKYQPLKNIIIKSLQTNRRLAGLSQIQQYLKRYSYHSTKDLLCAKVFSKLDNKIYEVYTCTDCAEEDNSTLCDQCFDISLHRGHNYNLRQVINGICDCGDKWKWEEKTFCKKHAYDSNQMQDRPEWASQYKEFTAYLIKMLCWLYEAMLWSQSESFINNSSWENKLTDKGEDIKKIIDQMGSFVIGQLILVNKNRTMNSQLFRQALHQEDVQSVNYPFSSKLQDKQQERVSLIQMLLNFSQLPRTSSKCVQLLMVLIFRSDQTLEQLTVEYLRRYTKSGDFARSNYHQLSPQLLSNSFMMRQIKGPLFVIRDFVDYNLQDEFQIASKVQKAHQYVDRYLLDLSKIINLRDECAQIYWNNFCQNRGFTKIANFSQMFNNEKALKVVNKRYYEIQQRFLKRFILIIDRHLSKNNLSLLVLQLFQTINNQANQVPNNYFFTYERMWALSVYLYLLRLTEDKSFSKIDDIQIIQLFRCLKIQNTGQSLISLQSILKRLIKRLFSYFIRIDTFLYQDNFEDYDDDNDDQNDDDLRSVKDTYFYSSNILPSVDTMFFRILLKLAKYVQKMLEQEKKISQKLVTSIINQHLIKLDQEIEGVTKQFEWTHIKNDLLFSPKLNQLTFFISRLLECIYSDLPDLVLSCRFKGIHSRQKYQQAYRQYYLNLLKTIKKGKKIAIQDFGKLAKHFLFEETTVIQKTIGSFESSETTLQNIKCKGTKINFSFFHSLKLKADNDEVKELIDINQINCDTFIYLPKEESLIDHKYFFGTLEKWVDYIVNNHDQYFTESSESQNSSIQDLSSSPINEIVKTLWTISRFNRNKNFHQYFSKSKFSKTIQIDRIQKYLKKEIKRLNSQNNNQDDQWSEAYRQFQEEQQILSTNEQILQTYLPESISSRKDQALPAVGNIVVEVKQPKCLTCKKEATKNQLLFQLCYVSQDKISPFYDLQPSQTNLYFSSCSHFAHKKCLSCFEKNICPQCDEKYNYLLFTEQNLNLTDCSHQIIIKQSFEEMKKCISLQGPSVEVRFFNSLLMFLLLLVSVPDHQLLLKAEILIVRNIFRVLKIYLNKQNEDYLALFKQNVRKYVFKGNLKCYYQNFISNVSQLLAFELLNEKTNIQALQIQGKQLIMQFFDNMSKPQLSFSKLCNIQSQDIFSLLPLQANLNDLQQSKLGLCKCQESQQSNVFYLCLLHKNEIKFCRRCYLGKMKQHISKFHLNDDAIAVRTDTGEVIYFRNDGEMKHVRIEAIYTNRLMQGFVPGKGKKKIQYTLNQTIYRRIATRYISKMLKT